MSVVDSLPVAANGYVCFYRGKRFECRADTSYKAQQQAVAHFKARKAYEVHVVLAEIGTSQVVHQLQDLAP